jgi:hypothetical protein
MVLFLLHRRAIFCVNLTMPSLVVPARSVSPTVRRAEAGLHYGRGTGGTGGTIREIAAQTGTTPQPHNEKGAALGREALTSSGGFGYH